MRASERAARVALEKKILAANVAADAQGVESHSFKDGFTNPMVWALSVIYLFFIMGLYGVGFWLPTLIKGSGVKDPLTIGFLTTLPYAAAAISMIVVGRSSDARRERRWHVAVPGLIGTLGWIVAVASSRPDLFGSPARLGHLHDLWLAQHDVLPAPELPLLSRYRLYQSSSSTRDSKLERRVAHSH